MEIAPVDQEDPPNMQNPQGTDPPLHIYNPPILPNLPPNPPPNQPPDQPQNLPPSAPMQPINPPNNPPNLMQPHAPPMQVPQLNWSYFKPEFSGKPGDNVVAYLLRANDWMETHNFPDETKVQRFCLTLMGEARLWYESLRPIGIDWTGLQECFRQQYSKFENTKEQYFHV